MKFGTPRDYLLLGGGELLLHFAMALKKRKEQGFVVTSPRHAREGINWDGDQRSLEDCLRERHIPYDIIDNINTDQNFSKRITPEALGLSFGAAWIFQEDFIKKFEGRLLNFHGTQLPKDRGGGGFSWRILQGNREGACLVHVIEEGIDRGDIIKQRFFRYPEHCRIPRDFECVYVEQMKLFFDEFLAELGHNKEFSRIPQKEGLSTYWPRLSTEEHGWINWSWPLEDVERFICVFDSPYRGAATFIRGEKVFLRKCSVYHGDGKFHPFQAGIIYRLSDTSAFIAMPQGALVVDEVVSVEGEMVMQRLKEGDRFVTPGQWLEKALAFRAIYTPQGLKENERTRPEGGNEKNQSLSAK